ncbi:penicillin-binding protein 2 [Halorhodospira abdelmalekii]|nr:penicillin-binding protein 2 [Halorhodospira abdelmalekii]
MRDQRRDARTIRSRIIIAGLLSVLAIAILLAQMVRLQVVEHQHYATLSHENRVKVAPVPPTRGLIYDRNGRILAENRPSYQLVITPERVPDLDATLAALRQVVAISDSQLERFQQQLQRSRHFEEIPLRTQLDESEVARLAVHRHRFPGIEVNARLVRHYPEGTYSSHVVGHVGHITREEQRRIDRAAYRGTQHIGKSGIELAFEALLHGKVGYERVETNALGRVLRTLERHPPQPGHDLILTLDSRLQRVAERALGDSRGAVVAIEPASGAILAMANRPSYDPNMFVEGMSRERFRELEETGWQPLYNRAIRATYPPASTIKPFVGLAALEHGVITPEKTIRCDGTYRMEGRERPFRCWREHGHGDVDYHRAIAESCNVYFYDTAFNLGIDRMSTFLAPFGFGKPLMADLEGERSGILPSREWKRGAIGQGWFHGETVITGIGLGYFSATPLQLAAATATLANRGTIVRPYLVETIRDGSNGSESRIAQTTPHKRIELNDSTYWDETIEGMRQTIAHPRGTGRLIGHDLPYSFAGKTGTAQVAERGDEDPVEHEQRPEHLRNHALFIGFAPIEEPQIAIAVVVEHGGSGAAAAAPIARAVTDAWLLGDLDQLEKLEAGRIDASAVEHEGGAPPGSTP